MKKHTFFSNMAEVIDSVIDELNKSDYSLSNIRNNLSKLTEAFTRAKYDPSSFLDVLDDLNVKFLEYTKEINLGIDFEYFKNTHSQLLKISDEVFIAVMNEVFKS